MSSTYFDSRLASCPRAPSNPASATFVLTEGGKEANKLSWGSSREARGASEEVRTLRGKKRKTTKAVIRSLATLLLAVGLSGCSIFPFGTRANEGPTTVLKPTRATTRITLSDLPNGVFVGIAMSGGGSRAANFSTAILFELEELGFLRTVSAISSVSGSSLAAAYYGLGDDPKRWNRKKVRELLLTDFQTQWIARWFLPHNIVRYWLTDFDRSDIMKAVFDNVLFEGKTFGDMPKAGPKILINATSLTEERGFLFTDEAFERLNSRLDTYPVSHAVMASGAFPGAFHNVTLEDYSSPDSYMHLFDGGPSDNLGIETLLDIIRKLYDREDGKGPRGCFLFIVDAFPFERGKGRHERDTRKALDFIVDDNVLDSADVLLSLRRQDVLREVGFTRPDWIGKEPYQQFKVFPGKIGGPHCSAWHFTFQGLLSRTDLPPRAKGVGEVVNRISTQYRLHAPGPHTAQELQDRLYEAAHILVREDITNRQKACLWFRDRGFTDLPCLEEGEPAR